MPETEVDARMERFTAATIAGQWDDVVKAMEEPPIDEAMANVGPMVDEAIQKIEEYAIPYFSRIAAELRQQTS